MYVWLYEQYDFFSKWLSMNVQYVDSTWLFVLMSAVYFIDVDTRRRAACDLVQALCKSFEGPVIQNFSQYVQGLLQV